MNEMINLSLKNMDDLDGQFRKLLPAVVNSIKDEKQTASITITLGFTLCEDSDSLINMSTKIKPTFAVEKKAVLCRRDLVGNLKVDPWDIGQAAIRNTTGNLFAGATVETPANTAE